MKKLLKTAFMSALICSAGTLQALPIGNPAEPGLLIDGTMWEGISSMDPCDPCATWLDAISLRAGFYGDYVFDRILKNDTSKNFKMGLAPTTKAIADFAFAAGSAVSGLTWEQATDITTQKDRPNPAYGKHMEDAEWCTNAAILSLNIWDRFDIFCTLGASSGYIKSCSAAFNLVGLIGAGVAPVNVALATGSTTNVVLEPLKSFSEVQSAASATDRAVPNVTLQSGIVELYTDTSFAWSVGARAALWECGCATLGAEFQYAQSKPKVENLNVICNVAQFAVHNPKGFTKSSKNYAFPLAPNAGVVATENTQAPEGLTAASIKYNEWQAGLALSYRLNMLVPYIGFKWANATFDAEDIRIAQPKLGTLVLGKETWNPTLLGEVPNIFDTMKTGATSANTGQLKVAAPDEFGVNQHFGQTLQLVSLQINKLKARKSCGFVVGATLIDADKWSITGEARLIDERAAHVSAQVRF